MGFYQYLQSEIVYPVYARTYRVQGRILVSFTVDVDGSLSGIRVLKGIGYGCDDEAIRVMQRSPKWIPGTVDGIPVQVNYTVPIKFELAAN